MIPREFEASSLVVGAGALWPQAIHADFLSAIGDSDLPRGAFERWLVWRVMSPNGGGQPSGELATAIDTDLAGFSAWFNVINWDEAARRFANATESAIALRPV